MPPQIYLIPMDDLYLSNPHDRFFKESFSRKEIACSFIKEYLPAILSSTIDFPREVRPSRKDAPWKYLTR
ncbi:hypothetical protein CHISP_3613 [Chitinispirillum alkaliphilum]|nr:hypothetical protein CHISP_3613 [Chitinispirillum alkaliphilum]